MNLRTGWNKEIWKGACNNMAWGIFKILLTVVLIPLILIGMVVFGLIYIAFPILIVIGIVSYIVSRA